MPDRQTLTRDLAETYTGGRYGDPWDYVEAYRAYLDYTAENPEEGSTSVARALEQPRGRIRVWMDGSKPDPVRAIEIAEQHDWLDWDWETDTIQALNCLVAWIFAGGSIRTETYVPLFTVDTDDDETVLRSLLQTAVNARLYYNDRTENRAREVTIQQHQAVLGRFLAILGAPVGTKNDDRADLSLPSYLREAPDSHRRAFARTYVCLRATDRPNRPNRPIQISERRAASYRAEIRALLNSLISGAVTATGQTFTLSKAAAEELYQPPTIGAS
ncbi:hypothetical protein GRX03_11970 [Halovenus sp. WSH3]|uniref:Uncharacterized protein n=1 Tax=Halovenus carboxidivorans TaxID=2692199 RepID=A0A6B0T7Y3_9EURY|nr:hypothetical protein [Halovenus carboxidivorans]MXR52316.1 hypothetical protein [Halovenus carboxidivorans]